MPIRRPILRRKLDAIGVRFDGRVYRAHVEGREIKVDGGSKITWARSTDDETITVTSGTRVEAYLKDTPAADRDELVVAGLIVSALVGFPRVTNKRKQMFVWTDHIALARGRDPAEVLDVSFIEDPPSDRIRKLVGRFEIVRENGGGARDAATPLIAPPIQVKRRPLRQRRIDSTPRRMLAMEREVLLREAALVEEFAEHMRAIAHDIGVFSIDLPGALGPLETDLFDFTDNRLIEAKGSVEREDIRMGIGQLVDYAYLLIEAKAVDAEALKTSLLLPEEPSRAIRNLLLARNIGVFWKHKQSFANELPAP